MRTRARPVLGCLLVLLLLVLLSPAPARGRAGGGGGFGGGGGGGGGGFGGGGGSFGGFSGGSRSGVRGGDFEWYHLIVVGVIVAFALYKGYTEGQRRYQGSVIRRGRRAQTQAARREGLGALQGRDPDFDEARFTDRVGRAFGKLQEAWCRQKLDPIRPFVSDGVFERFSLQIDEQRDGGYRDQMEQIRIHAIEVAEIRSGEVFDTVTVRIQASAVDYRVDAATGRRLSGTTSPQSFTEYWSFLRRPDARTLGGDGLMEGNCPNCGAGVELNAAAACEACGSLLRSGAYDWVLAEITQASEWQVTEPGEIPGVADLRRSDPAFSVQDLEDRVSVIFYRTMAARRETSLEPLRKVATEEFCQGFDRQLQPDGQGRHTFYADAAVGSAETLGVVLGQPQDRALVQVRWCAARAVRDSNGRLQKTNGAGVHTHVFVLVRDHGVTTSEKSQLAGAHCPNCGAAESRSEANACEYCGTVLGTGAAQWTLAALEPPLGETVRALRRELQGGAGGTTPPRGEPAGDGLKGGAEAAAWMVEVMLADGEIDEKERRLIDNFAARRNVPQQQVDLLVSAMQAGELDAPQPGSRDEARAWLSAMATMAMADGSVSKPEQKALVAMAKRLDFSAYDVKLQLAKARRRLYQQAKQRLRRG